MTLALLCILLAAQQEDTPNPDQEHRSAQERRHESPHGELDTGGWLGLRTALEQRGVQVHAFATTDASVALSGGLEDDASAFRALLDVTLTGETEKLFGLPGGLLFVDLQLQRGEDGSIEVGDLQAFSNIDALSFTRVAEAWLEQELWDAALTLRVGRIDANGGFAWIDNGVHFLNSSMGFSPTLVGLPTFPAATFGASGRVVLSEELSLSVGAFEADPSGSFLIAQSDATWEGGRLGLGAWRHTGQLERFDGNLEGGSSGEYLTLDQTLAEGLASQGDRLGGFLQLGGADEELSPFSRHLGLGVVWEGLGDEGLTALGLGVSHARLSDDPSAGFGASHETAWELFYSFAPTSWLHIKPDLQYIQNPGGDPAVESAWVFTLRSSLSF